MPEPAPAVGPLSGRIALVTGASRGIGAAVAKRLAGEGAHVVLMARTVGGLEEVDDEIRAAGGTATLIPQDLTRFAELDKIGPALAEKFGRLDILVGNAGLLGELTPISHYDLKTWERVFAVNVTANQRLIRSLDPLLRGSDAGRAVFVTSGVAQSARAYWGAYAASKAALEMMVRIYAAEVRKSSLKVNLLEPGRVRTAMRAKAYPGEDPATLPDPESLTDVFLALCSPSCNRHGEIIAG